MNKMREQELLTNELFRSLNGVCHECGEPGRLDNDFLCDRCANTREGPEPLIKSAPAERKEGMPAWLITVLVCVAMIALPPITS